MGTEKQTENKPPTIQIDMTSMKNLETVDNVNAMIEDLQDRIPESVDMSKISDAGSL